MKIFEASKEEEPQAVTTSFDAMYQNLKSKLFADEDRRGLEGRLKDALGIIKLMRTSSQVDRPMLRIFLQWQRQMLSRDMRLVSSRALEEAKF